MNCEDILGYSVVNLDAQDLIENIIIGINRPGSARWLACLNPHSFAEARRDAHFSRALHAADLLIADGIGIVYASSCLGGCIKKRITGSDVFQGINVALQKQGGSSVFFLGSTKECLADICDRFAIDYPQVRLAGTWSPPFKQTWSETELESMCNAINTAKPDVLWVGMTAPKQEKWIFDNLPRLEVKFAAAIGAVFDFYTGRVSRSSPIFQRLGLEWLPRLLRQPRRLWRRMFVSAPVFLWSLFKFVLTPKR